MSSTPLLRGILTASTSDGKPGGNNIRPLPHLPIHHSASLPELSPGTAIMHTTISASPEELNNPAINGSATMLFPSTNSTPTTSMVHLVTTRPSPPPFSAVKFAPLPELAPRKRKNTTPLGIAARGQMMARRRAMLAYGGPLPKSHPLNQPQQPKDPQQQEQQQQGSNFPEGQQQQDPSLQKPRQGDEEFDDPFIALGKMVKGVWKKVSNKDPKESDDSAPSTPTTPLKSGSVKLKKQPKSSLDAPPSSDSTNDTDPTSPPPPPPTKHHSRKSALVVADEADTAGAIAPIVHAPNADGSSAPPSNTQHHHHHNSHPNHTPSSSSSLTSQDDSSDSEEDDNWQTATIRPPALEEAEGGEIDSLSTEDDEHSVRTRSSSVSNSVTSSSDEEQTLHTPTFSNGYLHDQTKHS